MAVESDLKKSRKVDTSGTNVVHFIEIPLLRQPAHSQLRPYSVISPGCSENAQTYSMSEGRASKRKEQVFNVSRKSITYVPI